MTDSEQTTVTISRKTLRRLHGARLYRRETMEEVLARALSALEEKQGPKLEARTRPAQLHVAEAA